MFHHFFALPVQQEHGVRRHEPHARVSAPVGARRSWGKRLSLLALTALVLAQLSPSSARAENLSRGGSAAQTERTIDVERWHEPRCRAGVDGETFFRTELFFGLSRPGGIVTETEFQTFVGASVTPLFPDGLTLLSGVGQFRDASGTTIVEGSKLLILLYPRRDAQASKKIEQIRTDYKRQFQQQSVLRTDELSCVSF